MPLNKRKYHRTPVARGVLPPAKMTLYKPFFHEPFDVLIKDLSAGGMKVISPEILPLFFEFGLEFNLPGTEAIHAKAKAVNQLRVDEEYEIGVVFTQIEEDVHDHLMIMGIDFMTCEDRIRLNSDEICVKECRFLSLCQKPQKAY